MMPGEATAGWVIGTLLIITASTAHGQSAGEASVRLNGVPVIQVTASGNESATARAARIERRLERLADRVDDTARPVVPSVRVRLLGTADMILELRFWTDSRRADLLATTSVVRRRVVEAFSEAGLPLPEPDLRRLELLQ